ncbi:MAG: serine O-acetyltransferase [Alphaproteobacteria bacterium]|nr:serine O-acetyltransferase [Alphaproteobacteria bacterium]
MDAALNTSKLSETERELIESVWADLRASAAKMAEENPLLKKLGKSIILDSPDFATALSRTLSRQHLDVFVLGRELSELFLDTYRQAPNLVSIAATDIIAVSKRDPACTDPLYPFLFFKGFQALQLYRVAHWFWERGQKHTAVFLQNRSSVLYAVDIHPAARIGKGIMLDHAHSIVIGETAVVEDNVSLLHEVTLGGTGKERGDRHPKVRKGVMIGAGAKILGNVEIGEGASVAAGSVVLNPVPPHTTVAGVPAKIVGKPKTAEPATEMDQSIPEGGLAAKILGHV